MKRNIMQYRGRDRIRKLLQGGVAVELTAGQTEPLGVVVGHIYYTNHALGDMLPQHDYSNGQPVGRTLTSSGYPHNGGEHTMIIYGPKGDVQAFLELAGEHYLAIGENAPRYKDGGHELMFLAKSLSRV
jgi:hypothetical protein